MRARHAIVALACALAACGSLAPTDEERAACADAIAASESIDVGSSSPDWNVRTGSDGRSVTLAYRGSGARPGITCVLRDGAVRSITVMRPDGRLPSVGPSGPDELDI